MTKMFIGWGVLVVLASVFVVGFFSLKGKTSGDTSDITFATVAIGEIGSTTAPAATPTGPREVRTPPEGLKEYRSSDYHFSFFYPNDLPPQESHDRGFATTIAFQKGAGEPGFQIYVAPINGNTITQERFLQDAPSGVRRNTKNVMVDGAQAVSFNGFDARIGDTYEVWFIRGGFLYEVSTYKEVAPSLDQLLSTWRFE